MTTVRLPALADLPLITLTGGAGLVVQVHENGVPAAFRLGSVLINAFIPGAAEDGLGRIVLHDREARTGAPIHGRASGLTFTRVDAHSVAWSGTWNGLAHQVILTVDATRPLWFWTVQVSNQGTGPRLIDLRCGQDLCLTEAAHARRQEAYLSQYIDQRALRDAQWGWLVAARQGQDQGAGAAHPWAFLACLDGAAAYATDGVQFFGADHRLTQQPLACTQDLPSRVLQAEASYPALQSRGYELAPGAERVVTFVGGCLADHPAATSDSDLAVLHELIGAVRPVFATMPSGSVAPASLLSAEPLLAGDELAEEAWITEFPGVHSEIEREASQRRLSFFVDGRHVVARAKEVMVARPHGWVLRSGRSLWVDTEALGSTIYAAGIFNGQVHTGNPSCGRLLSPARDHLGLTRSSGQRVWIHWEGRWRQLGVPSAFAMHPHGALWLYRFAGAEVRVELTTAADRSALSLAIRCSQPLAIRVSHQLGLGDHEHDAAALVTAHADGWLAVEPPAGSPLAERRAGTALAIAARDPGTVAALGGDELLYADGVHRGGPFAVLASKPTTGFTVILAATHAGVTQLPQAVAAARACVDGASADGALARITTGGLRLRHAEPGVGRLNTIVPWFAHHAWIHFTIPHGIEQCDGGAWGVRDVSQGDIEWLLAVGQPAAARQALRLMLAHQFPDGSFPQYFLVPPYDHEMAFPSHGDVAVWPVKAVSDWIAATGDLGLLDEVLPFTDPVTRQQTTEYVSVRAHIDRCVEHLRSRCIAGTSLIDYGEGDWDDTLQPADPALRHHMVSAWTVELTYQAIGQWAEVCRRDQCSDEAARLDAWCVAMRADTVRLLMPDGVIAGFAVFDGETPRPVVHPRDTTTGIRYRLLPMTRGIISGLFTRDEAQRHLALIREHLLFPDGARLTSDPLPYRGGPMTLFRRAESAANFGREIGLLYIHAHIRYAEAMARLGEADALWRALAVMNPIGLQALVPHADLRQANTYFSSSDGDFPDRYAAQRDFAKLRDGSVAVKAGWRFHSSGPGLFLNKVMTCLLGWREQFGELIIDPVLPIALDGLEVSFTWRDRPVTVRYRVTGGGVRAVRCAGVVVESLGREANPYRSGGLRFAAATVFVQVVAGKVIEVEL